MPTQPTPPQPPQRRGRRSSGVTQPHTAETPEPAKSYPFGQDEEQRTITQDEQERLRQSSGDELATPKPKPQERWDS